jgi:hypothetical protein
MTAVVLMNESQLVKTITTLIAKGDHAKGKADQFYIAAGKHLESLKADGAHKRHDMAWAAFVEKFCGIGRSRADELIMIADGRTTVAETRTETARRVKKHDQKPPLANGGNNSQAVAVVEPEDDDDDTGPDEGPLTTGVNPVEARRRGLLYRASEALRLAQFDDLVGLTIDGEMRKAIASAAQAWQRLLQQDDPHEEAA